MNRNGRSVSKIHEQKGDSSPSGRLTRAIQNSFAIATELRISPKRCVSYPYKRLSPF